jgi:hypothetical protein
VTLKHQKSKPVYGHLTLRHFRLYKVHSYLLTVLSTGFLQSDQVQRYIYKINWLNISKQLVNFITCGCESSAPFFIIYKAGCEPTPYCDRLVWVVRSNDLTHWGVTFECCLVKLLKNYFNDVYFNLSLRGYLNT